VIRVAGSARFAGTLALLIVCGGTRSVLAAEPPTPERAIGRRLISDLQPSPDGRRLAFVVAEPPKGDKRMRHVWVLDVRTREARQFTRSAKSEWAPRWSPDGRRLAFYSDRGEKTQLWLMPSDLGEGERLAEEEVAGHALEWSPDGRQIAYLAKEPKKEEDEKREKAKDDAKVVDKDDGPERLFIVEVESRKSRCLLPAPWKASAIQWSPAGDRLFAVATDRPASDRWTERIISVGIKEGAVTELATPVGPIEGLRISPDGGRNLAYVANRDGGPEPHDLFLLPLAAGGGGASGVAPGGSPPRNLTGRNIDRSVDAFGFWRDGSLAVLVEKGFGTALYDLKPDGRSVELPALPTTASDLVTLEGAPPSAQTIAVIGESATEAPEIWMWAKGGQAQAVTGINEGWGRTAWIRPELTRYKSSDGVEIEAALLKPAGFLGQRGLPLVVLAHGGPTGRWSDQFEPWGQLLAAQGIAVLYPNVRGSTGYGSRFLGMNRGDWGGGDFKDILAGVEAVIARGVADPDRLGIGGWSYGGYMAMWAVTQTPRFKAAVAGAGMSDLAGEFGTEDDPAYDEWFFGLPYENLDQFTKHSPITYVSKATTPMLILQGEEDSVDPPPQSAAFYRALKRYGIPAEYVVYPREGHEIKEEKHLLDRLTRVVKWFKKYLG
jgi:dipeptidyl aminopeptidase/acylaminoacyl peptidase